MKYRSQNRSPSKNVKCTVVREAAEQDEEEDEVEVVTRAQNTATMIMESLMAMTTDLRCMAVAMEMIIMETTLKTQEGMVFVSVHLSVWTVDELVGGPVGGLVGGWVG